MNLLAAVVRWRTLVAAIAAGGLLALLTLALVAQRPPQGAPARPSPLPATERAPTVTRAAPSERQAAAVAVAFGRAYFSGGNVLPYLTPGEARRWSKQASGATSAAATVAGVTATFEGAASHGSLGFIVDASVNTTEQGVEVFLVAQNGHSLIEKVKP